MSAFQSCNRVLLNNGICLLFGSLKSVNNKAFWNNGTLARAHCCWAWTTDLSANAQQLVMRTLPEEPPPQNRKRNVKFKPDITTITIHATGREKCVTIHDYKTVVFAPFQNTLSRSCYILGLLWVLRSTRIERRHKIRRKKNMLKRNLLCCMIQISNLFA